VGPSGPEKRPAGPELSTKHFFKKWNLKLGMVDLLNPGVWDQPEPHESSPEKQNKQLPLPKQQ
jgi:hypothetical protein